MQRVINMSKTNNSVIRTKKYLRKALVELMRRKPLAKITVKELTEEAEISESTFYNHYHSVFDFYEQVRNELIDDTVMTVYKFSVNSQISDFKQLIKALDYEIGISMLFLLVTEDVEFFEILFEKAYSMIDFEKTFSAKAIFDKKKTAAFILAGFFGVCYQCLNRNEKIDYDRLVSTAIKCSDGLYDTFNFCINAQLNF